MRLFILPSAGLLFLLSTQIPLAAQNLTCRTVPFEVVGSGFKAPEGPSFDSTGNLYVVCYKRLGDIGVIHPDGSAEVWVDLGESEANGTAYSPDGHLFCCDHNMRRIISIDMKTKEVSVVVDSYEGGPLQRPNDIFLASDGNLYFTDPYRENENEGGRVFCFDRKEKKLYLLLYNLPYPNGLTVSSDCRTLYVGSTTGNNVTRYPLEDGGHKAGPGEVIFRMEGKYGPDGLELDEKGNLYVSHYGTARVYYITTEGKLISCATGFGTDASNVQIHGPWLYVTEDQKGEVLRIKRSEFEEK